ncbi:hypothetical protein BaOVIS_013520 [Babesia ovis]|uniref:Uncharacterized protein n=1 Tax=Babesia ovis TaxID=5869 RepID=A0A9W5T9X1_BABOV|nr:hypothetical protein BaOVIS_013520 [Babesia ovis]
MNWQLVLFCILLPRCVLSSVLHSTSSTIDSICANVVFSITLLNRHELVKLVNKAECGDYQLLGEDVLRASHRGDHYCYSQVSPVLCESRYTPIKAQPNCEHIKSKFMTIVQGCIEDGSPGKHESNCSGLNTETLTITDPFVFCKLAFTTADGTTRVSFNHNEVDDCQALSESYNHCQNVGNAFNHPRFCIDGGFQGYCNSRIQRVHDDVYNELCRNVVVPFVFSMMDDGYQNVSSSFCRNADDSLEQQLLAKRDALMNRSQELVDTLDSEEGFVSWERDMEGKLKSLGTNLEQLVNLFNLASTYTYNFLGMPYCYDSLVRHEAEEALKLCDDLVSSANALPSSANDMTSLITRIDPVLSFDKRLQEAIIHLKHFYSLLTSGAHSTILGSQYYRPLDHHIFMRAQRSLSQVRSVMAKRLSVIGDFLSSHVSLLYDADKEHRVHESASELRSLATLHESQLQWLLRSRGKRTGRAISRSVQSQHSTKDNA